MKSLIKLTLAIVMFAATFAAQSGTVRGYYRSNGTYVMPHYRTPANGTPYDNLSYRGYPSQQPGYVSPRSYGLDSSSRSAYVYRNPYATTPSVSVSGYRRSDGATVLPYYRTPANRTVTDNLSYRGYGTVRVLRNSYGW